MSQIEFFDKRPNDQTHHELVMRVVDSIKMPVRVFTTLGRKSRDLVISSHLLDRPKCPKDNYQTREALEGSGEGINRNFACCISCTVDGRISATKTTRRAI